MSFINGVGAVPPGKLVRADVATQRRADEEDRRFRNPRTREDRFSTLVRSDALLELLFNVIDDPRLAEHHSQTANIVRELDMPAGDAGLLARWEASLVRGEPLRNFTRWLELGSPTSSSSSSSPADSNNRLNDLFDDLIAMPSVFPEGWKTTGMSDSLLAQGVDEIPEKYLRPLLLTFSFLPDLLPQAQSRMGKRIVENETQAEVLHEILNDDRLTACHPFAAGALVGAEGVRGARAILDEIERKARLALPLAQRGGNTPILGGGEPDESTKIVGAKVLRFLVALADAHALRADSLQWMEVIQERLEHLPYGGRAILVVIACDAGNVARSRAVALLAAAVSRATDPMEKRYALYALGQSRHPNATPVLLAAFDDPQLREIKLPRRESIADATPLVCTAIAQCADMRAIPTLEKYVDGPHKAFVQNAINTIRSKVAALHKAILLAASHETDAMIVDLAQRMREGDYDATAVLEDALRERGRLT